MSGTAAESASTVGLLPSSVMVFPVHGSAARQSGCLPVLVGPGWQVGRCTILGSHHKTTMTRHSEPGAGRQLTRTAAGRNEGGPETGHAGMERLSVVYFVT